MAHFLRGKQAGVQSDLSNGIAADFFVLDDVCHLQAQRLNTYRLTVPVCPLWSQFTDLRLRLRSRPISPRSRYERITVRGRAHICLRPEACMRHTEASAEVLDSGTQILCRQAHSARQQERCQRL